MAAVVPLDAARAGLASAASVLAEAAPFVLAGNVLARFARARPWAIAYVGCGCGQGPAARSIPAAIATWVLFGPAIATARVAAASLIALVVQRERAGEACAHRGDPLLGDLGAMVVPALLAGVASQATAYVDLARVPAAASIAAGLALGFAASPCALGGVAVAAALHARAPLCAAAFLCVAGLVDARTIFAARARAHSGDAFAALLAAAALGCIAMRGGASLVHPLLALPLGACALASLASAVRRRGERNAALRVAPAILLAGTIVAAPVPHYHATETTLAGAFPGERIDFLGTLARDRTHDALVRYAIVCCRADASPVVLRLAARAAYPPGTWLRARGTIEMTNAGGVLVTQLIERAATPADPFVYR